MMINRILLSLVLFLSLSSGLEAQSWGSIGDQWVYLVAAQTQKQYLLYEVEKDTTIMGVNCKKMTTTLIEYLWPGNTRLPDVTVDPVFFSVSNDSVRWFNGNQFVFVYQLHPSVGDQWTLPENPNLSCPGTSLPPQDNQAIWGSNSRTLPSGQTVTELYIQGGNDWYIGYQIYEGIGPVKSLYPTLGPNCASGHTGQPTMLVCYRPANSATSYVFGTQQSCTETLTSQQEVLVAQPYQLFPNPTSGRITVYGNAEQAAVLEVRIFDLLGRAHYQSILRDSTFDIAHLTPGLYLVQLLDIDSGEILFTDKMIKR